MMNAWKIIVFAVFASSALLPVSSAAQVRKEFTFPVSYVSSTTVYISAGRDDSLAVGDTLTIVRNSHAICTVVTVAVSRHSTASQIVLGKGPALVGDTALITKTLMILPEAARDSLSSLLLTPRKESVRQDEQHRQSTGADQNVVSGRAAVQYSGVLAEDSRFNLSQPSTLLRLEVAKLFGTNLKFSMYGRSYYDISANYNRFGDETRLKIRMYEFTLSDEQPDRAFGYTAGRVTSRFVGGLGTFDGGQLYYRVGDFTSGILYGAQVADRTMSIDGDDRRGAFFLNYRSGSDFLHQYDGTIAYARQMFEGKLDREFIYLQNLATLGTQLNIYQSAEVETQDINNGTRKTSPKLSNTFFSINYYPIQWLSANIGYDASTTVYLFETMKTTSDTLIDRNYLQGYRANATIRFPYSISLSANGTYRSRKDDPRDARTLGSTLRMSGIAGSEFNAGVRYMDIRGVYYDGKNATLDVDRSFLYSLSVALRFDYYTYTLLNNSQTYNTYTATGNINYRITREIYSALNFDRVWDSTMNSYRIYLEAGIRF
jgi:hypothetical protein